MYMPYPVQIVQSDSTILMMSEFASAQRTIYIGGKSSPPADTWMGWSNARWEGDTLVIDSRGFMGGTISALDPEGAIQVRFLDRAGNYHTDGLHVVERIRRIGPDHLSYQATIEDPNVYTRPWTISMPLYRRLERGHAAWRVQMRGVRERPDVRQVSEGAGQIAVTEIGMRRPVSNSRRPASLAWQAGARLRSTRAAPS